MNKKYYYKVRPTYQNTCTLHTSNMKNIVTTSGYTSVGTYMEKILSENKNIVMSDGNFVSVNAAENFHVIYFNNQEFLDTVIKTIAEHFREGNW